MNPIDIIIRNYKLQLGKELSDKILIYLDQNYWIRLRKCFLNQPIESEYYDFFNLLKSLIEQNKVLCPINHSVFFELLKQNDIESRLNTARVIDLFSKSVTLIFEFERDDLELDNYVKIKLLNEQYVTLIKEYVWVKIPYIMGLGYFVNDNIDKELQQKLQIEFFYYSWDITLEEMISHNLPDINPPFWDTSKLASELNQGKMLHNDEMKSLSNLFKIELKGVLSVFIEEIEKYYLRFTQSYPEKVEKLQRMYKIRTTLDLCRKIEEEYINNTMNGYLPRIYINTCFHTLIRWNRNRKYKPNDFYDLEHARAALPYFNYFFTETSLEHLLKSNPFELSEKYDCIVESKIKNINEILKKIAS